MSPVGRVVQGLYLIFVGIAFSVRGVIALQDPDFWEPVTDLDYAAIWTHSLALLLACLSPLPSSSWSARPKPGRPRLPSRG